MKSGEVNERSRSISDWSAATLLSASACASLAALHCLAHSSRCLRSSITHPAGPCVSYFSGFPHTVHLSITKPRLV